MNSIITGASKGLGRAMAERFAAAGYNIALVARDGKLLSAVQAELEARHPEARFQSFAVDMSKKEQVASLGKGLVSAGVEVDVLVNNAGQFIPGSVYDEEDGALEKMLAVNLYSAYHLTRALLPGMMARKKGHIFNICSVASLQAYPNGGAYSISKFALAGFSRNLREEMKPHGIKVTAVYPGAALTASWAGSGIDPRRIMEAGDVADMVLAASRLSPQATVEEILLRPQLGDL